MHKPDYAVQTNKTVVNNYIKKNKITKKRNIRSPDDAMKNSRGLKKKKKEKKKKKKTSKY